MFINIKNECNSEKIIERSFFVSIKNKLSICLIASLLKDVSQVLLIKN